MPFGLEPMVGQTLVSHIYRVLLGGGGGGGREGCGCHLYQSGATQIVN